MVAFLMILSAILVILLLAWLARPIRDFFFTRYIQAKSDRYQEIVALNREYLFFQVNPDPSYTVFVQDKAHFDAFIFDEALISMIARDVSRFDAMLYAADSNKRALRGYHEALEMGSPEISRKKAKALGVSYIRASKAEQKSIRDILPEPVTEVAFRFTVRYYCPVQRKDLQAVKVYALDDLVQLRAQVAKPAPTQIVYRELFRWPRMWRVAKVQCEYRSED